MKHKLCAIAIAALLLPGCVGLGGRRSSFHFSEDGKTIAIICQSDGRCTHKPDGTVEVDNRGPLGQVWAAGAAAIGKGQEAVKEAVKW